MGRRRTAAPPPLPLRDGLGPDRIRLTGAYPTVGDHLRALAPDDDWDARFVAGEVVDRTGRPLPPSAPARPGLLAYFYREPPAEVPVPFAVDILHHGDGLLVVDKPHFLATIPRGRHIRESVVVRLRRALDLPDVVPVHRLDRMTAGVLVCTYDPRLRGPYQQLFEQRRVVKEYEALAPFLPGHDFPMTVRSRIDKRHGEPTAREVAGDPNAHTDIEVIERVGDHARYRLVPTTGRTHQLRLHLSSLGAPIVGDDFYPTLRDRAPDDFTDPLRLLARSIRFTDPVTGAPRVFTSRRTLTDGPAVAGSRS
ncbi:pseudouridine synthase [Rhodococcus sp. NPDC058532]|uniref:pseudouridine synthase n=1 Tax=Rhodococcus sp. NPDC058532 TaxID=3346540 RepID=UPI003669B294